MFSTTIKAITAKCLAAGTIFILAPSSSAQAGIVVLSVTADQVSKTWDVFAEQTDTSSVEQPARETVGLAGFDIDVTADGNISITSSVNESPIDPPSRGFSTFRQDNDGTPGLRVNAGQPTIFSDPSSVFDGVGLVAGSDGSASWDFPVLLASGSYSGDNGTIFASDHPRDATTSGFNLLIGDNGVWGGDQADVEPATAVINGRVTIPGSSNIPEPTSLAVWSLLGLTLTGAAWWRCRGAM